MITALHNGRIFDGTILRYQQTLLFEDNKIIDICQLDVIPSHYHSVDLKQHILLPGFVDLQVNGGGGVLFNNQPSIETLQTMATAHAQLGTTSIMPTLISDRFTTMQQGLLAVQQAALPSVLGIHFEGPFLSKQKAGVHHPSHLRKPSLADIEFLQHSQVLTLLTFAPEALTSTQIAALRDAGLLLFIGHSNASFEKTLSAFSSGAHGFTHLYNAMSGLSAREPGVAGAALTLNNAYASIIVDQRHVDQSMFQLAYQAKPLGKLFLVSDAMATIGSNQPFLLYGQTISKENGTLTNADGKLAGSAACLLDALKILVNHYAMSIEQAAPLVSSYPATCLNLADTIGFLKPKAQANMVLVDDQINLKSVWLQGEKL